MNSDRKKFSLYATIFLTKIIFMSDELCGLTETYLPTSISTCINSFNSNKRMYIYQVDQFTDC